MDAALIRVERLKKYFPVTRGTLVRHRVGEVRAVDDVSFSISDGQTFAIVGESGCGKTTLARTILRLEMPTAGSVRVRGRDVHTLRGPELKQYRMQVQAVFQDPWGSLNPRMRVHETIAEPIVVNQRVDRGLLRERIRQLLVQVGLQPSSADLFPHEFSGGQRQRIALAQALISEPRLIVLDEPVSALDVSVQAQVMNLLKAVQRQRGVSYLLVAHNLATVRYLAHRVGVMYLGQLVEEAASEALFTQPLHPYTRALFAAALPTQPDRWRPENLVDGEVPSPLNPPSGCRFHTRCPLAMDRCRMEAPERKEAAPDHFVACHLY